MQRITIIGHLGANAEKKALENGQIVLNFNVAVTEKVKNEKQTTWYRCTKFVKEDKISQYLTKGTMIYIDGAPKVNSYQNKDSGEWKATLDIIVNSFELLGGGQKQNETQPSNDKKEDDLPF